MLCQFLLHCKATQSCIYTRSFSGPSPTVVYIIFSSSFPPWSVPGDWSSLFPMLYRGSCFSFLFCSLVSITHLFSSSAYLFIYLFIYFPFPAAGQHWIINPLPHGESPRTLLLVHSKCKSLQTCLFLDPNRVPASLQEALLCLLIVGFWFGLYYLNR